MFGGFSHQIHFDSWRTYCGWKQWTKPSNEESTDIPGLFVSSLSRSSFSVDFRSAAPCLALAFGWCLDIAFNDVNIGYISNMWVLELQCGIFVSRFRVYLPCYYCINRILAIYYTCLINLYTHMISFVISFTYIPHLPSISGGFHFSGATHKSSTLGFSMK